MTTIDVHAHVGAPTADALLAEEPDLRRQFAEEARSLGAASALYNREQITSLLPVLTDPAARLAAMDAAGIDVQTVSATPISRPWMSEELSARYYAAVNASVVEHCAADPSRLAPVAAVALHHPELAVRQLTHAVEELGCVGVQISTAAAPGIELDHPSLDEFWSLATSLDVPVLIHPWGCTLGERLDVGYMFNHFGNPTETAVALNRLIFGGTLDRHPALRIWAAHAGGWFPSYSGRADHAWSQRSDARTCEHAPSEYLRGMWFDALVYTAPALRFLVESVGSAQVTLGTDFPFDMGVADPVQRVEDAISDPEMRRDIFERSARTLFGDRLEHRLGPVENR